MNIFEKATKRKYRFKVKNLTLSTEDLWDLPLVSANVNKVSLDDVAKETNREMKKSEEESFVAKKNSVSYDLQSKMDILKHIISVRQKEQEDRESQAQRAEEAQYVMEILKERRLDSLKGKSTEELEKLVK